MKKIIQLLDMLDNWWLKF